MSKKYGFSSTNEQREDLQEDGLEIMEDSSASDKDSLMIPISAWEAVLGQLGNIHEASQEMAEARERAAKAEAENDFLRERIINLKEDIEILSKKKRKFFSN